MFRNLVESGSHRSDFKRKGAVFAATLAFYGVILCAAGVGSIYAYNARVEDRKDLELLTLMHFPTATSPEPERRDEQRPAGAARTQAARVKELVVMTPYKRPVAVTDAPVLNRKIPVIIDPNASSNYVPPEAGGMPSLTVGGGAGSGMGANVYVPPTDDEAPVRIVKRDERAHVEPQPIKPDKPLVFPSSIIASKAISKPVPLYPDFARRIGAHGTVAVQILVDEQGHVVSAQATSGHPLLQKAAADAALRARFTPTLLNGQPVKVSGVILYNFTLQ